MTVANLTELVAPLTRADFLTRLRERQFGHFKGVQSAAHAGLIGWETFRAALPAVAPDDLRVTRDSALVSPVFYSTGGKLDLAKIDAILERGASVVINYSERYIQALRTLADSIAAETGEEIMISVIVTRGEGGAFSLHYDVADLLVLQLEGEKRWLLSGPAVYCPIKYRAGADAPPTELFFNEVLRPGDVLMVPSGSWHRCENQAGRSLHATFMFQGPTGCHLVHTLSKRVEEDELFRTPLNRAQDRAAMERELRQRLMAMVDELTPLGGE